MSKLYNTWLGYFLFGICVFSSSLNAKETIHVAVASNFKTVLQTLLQDSPIPGIQVKISAASSGVLYSQIVHGAPFDVFLSADDVRPQALIKEGFASQSSLITYALGELAVWQPNANRVNNKVAIANPRFSPYGQASEFYANANFKKPINYVYGNNITQAFQFVQSGNASVGVVAVSTLKMAFNNSQDPQYLSYKLIPPSEYPEIIQQGVIIKSSKKLASAQKLMDFLMTSGTQLKLVELGYRTKDSNASK
ncbi:molybdate ABC transporter substrate-binding protein [Pseudoalteromonas marina]|uniref:molybdate ABC transporter substrate-binding protein n=1 Tax=Pseudoalteromonas marina TaxID=267375 RepID=UPI0023F04A4E|nr:molybdate ABC transporter substrate-binding protein [Pseudoalteromonas marina]